MQNFDAYTGRAKANDKEQFSGFLLFVFTFSSFVSAYSYTSTRISSPCLIIYTLQQTQNICIAFVQRLPNVFDVGPTLYKCYTLCFVVDR